MKADTWIERVRTADAEAEEAWQWATKDPGFEKDQDLAAAALIAIAAELRAARIARRTGGGQ